MERHFTRITKQAAKELFTKGQTVYFCPAKMRPGWPWNIACPVSGREYMEHAKDYEPREGEPNFALWEGTLADTAWSLAYSNWSFYNTSWECGYYAHYYI